MNKCPVKVYNHDNFCVLEVMEVKKSLLIAGICSLCFFGIPIRVNKNDIENEEKLFQNYIIKFNKSYNENDTLYFLRFKNFRKSLRLIEEFNKNRSNNHSAIYGLTMFSDLSQNEFFQIRLQKSIFNLGQGHQFQSSFKTNYQIKDNIAQKFLRKRSTSLPMKVDWRVKGIIGSVHNQRTCGACWAFSTIETVEAMNALKTGSLVELSVQEAVDCAQFGNFGCEGGDSCSLLNWLVSTQTKITTEKLYPFEGKTDLCKMKNTKTGVQVQKFLCEKFVGVEEKLLEKLAEHGPVVAAVNALNWQNYLGGVIQFHCPGEPQHLNHAVQIVGYDRTGPVPYYIARNSWGTEFGVNGYAYIAIGGNICGLASQISSLDVL